MNRGKTVTFPTCRRVFLCVVVATAIFVGRCASGQTLQEGLTDIVFALDVSASMQADGNFDKVRARLIEFIDDEVDLGTNISVIAFGEEARLVGRQAIKAKEDREALVARLRQMTAEAQATYMAAGIDLALAELSAMRQDHPDRSGMLVMLTDGKNQPPQHVATDQQMTFSKLREKYAHVADFLPGEDWFFWYCFIGSPDAEVRQFVESMAGESKPVTGPWKFLKVRFNRVVLRLPDVLPGTWQSDYPTEEDRTLGEQLVLSTKSPGDYILQISNVVLDDPQPNEQITVTPRSIKMDKAEQNVVLQFSGKNIAPGPHRGRILFRAPGKMVFIQPQQFHVTFRAVEARLSVAPRDGIEFGRILPGQSVERTVDLVPNEAARRLVPNASLAMGLPQDLPDSVTLVAESTTVSVAEPVSIRLKLTASSDGELPADGYRGVLQFSKIDGLAVDPASLPISFEGRRRMIEAVLPSRTIDFGPISPGGKAELQFVLVPNEAAKQQPVTALVKSSGDLPEGVQLTVEPSEAEVVENTTVRLTLAIDEDCQVVGDMKGTVLLTSDAGVPTVRPDEIGWQARTAEAVVNVLPWEQLDFGKLEPGDEQTEVLYLQPDATARARRPKVRFSSAFLPNGTKVAFEPSEIVVDSKKEVRVTIVAGAEIGKHHSKLQLACTEEAVELAVTEVPLVYEGILAEAVIDTERLVFENVVPGDSKNAQSLQIVGGEAGIGKTIAFDWRWDDPVFAAQVTAFPSQKTLGAESELVPVRLEVTDGRPGEYLGYLVLSAEEIALANTRIPISVVIGEPSVVVHCDPIQASPRTRSEELSCAVRVEANKFAAGSELTLEVKGELPTGVEIVLAPSPLVLEQGETKAEVLIRWKGPARPPRGLSYNGTIEFRPSRKQLMIENGTIPVDLSVPVLSVVELWLLAVATTAIVAGAVFVWRVWPRKLQGRLCIETLGQATIRDEATEFSEGQAILLDDYDSSSILIGGDAECTLQISSKPGQYARIRRNNGAGTYVQRCPKGEMKITLIPSDDDQSKDTRVAIEPGKTHPLTLGDRIEIGDVTLQCEDFE